MANHAYIHTEESIDASKLKELLDAVNEERFGGKLVFQVDEGGDYFMALIDDYNSYIEIFIPEKGSWSYEEGAKLEVRHGHAMDLSWYTDLFISHWIAEKVDGTVIDDGTGENEKPYFHTKYPRLSDWYARKRNPFRGEERKMVGEEMWAILGGEKVSKRC